MTTFYTQSTDIIFPGTNLDALPFNTDDEVYTIAPNVLVASDVGTDAVSSAYNGSSLINYGSLFSPDHDGALRDAATNVDRITDFTPAQHDKIVLSETYFAGLGPLGTLATGHFHVGAAVTANQHIIYTPGNGFLYYHSDAGTTHFATLTTHPALHNTDFIVEA